MNCIYHYTDTIRLPWILETGELRPSPNRVGDLPPDFLWATTDENGDRTSSAAGKAVRKLWHEGHLLLIRFVLDAVDFKDWEPVAQASGWTKNQINALKQSARSLGEHNTKKWRCRPVALPIAKILRIEAKSSAQNAWAAPSQFACISSKDDPDFRAVLIDDFGYGGIRKEMSDGLAAYDSVHRFPVRLRAEPAAPPHSDREAF